MCILKCATINVHYDLSPSHRLKVQCANLQRSVVEIGLSLHTETELNSRVGGRGITVACFIGNIHFYLILQLHAGCTVSYQNNKQPNSCRECRRIPLPCTF